MQVAINTLAATVAKSGSVISRVLSSITFGELSESLKLISQDLEKTFEKLRDDISGDLNDIADSGRSMADVIDEVKDGCLKTNRN